MEKVKLGDVATYINGYAFKPTDWSNEGVLIIRIQDLTGNSYQANRYNGNYEKKYEIQKGDVLISWSASLGVYVWQGETAVLNQHIFKVVFDKVEIDKNFFVHQVECILKNASSEAHGATMKHLTKPVFDALPFYLPSLEEQKAIAERLDKVSGLIEKRKTQLEKLDLLIKSRFIEMFIGQGYPTKTIDQVSLVKGEYGAQSASVEYDPNRPRYVRITDINDDGTLNDDFVSSINPIDDKQYRLEYGDFMFARMGATVGKTYAFIEGNQIFAGYLIRYKLNQQLINPRYLYWYTRLDEYWNWVKLNQSGAAQPGINAKKYGSLQVPIPPMELQEQFAAFVEQVEKSKFEIQKSLEKLEILKKSLMQQYFG